MIRASLCKAALFRYLIHPLFYVSAVFTVLFVSFRFFLAEKFFVQGVGSANLRGFFGAFPPVSVVTVPLLVLRLRDVIRSDSLPFSPLSKLVSVALSAWCAFAFPVLLLCSVPASVGVFGAVDGGQAAAGFAGVLLFALASVSLSVFLFSACSSRSLALVLSVALLFGTNVVGALPAYLDVGGPLSFLCRKLSFSSAFEPFGKGIVDSRSVLSYALASFLFLFLAAAAEERRMGKRMPALTKLLLALTALFSVCGGERLYARADLTRDRLYSVSPATVRLVARIDEPLRMTYFYSRELSELYPQAADVREFLKDFSLSGRAVSLSMRRISARDAERVAEYGVRGQQIRTDDGTRTEYVTVYSAILLQYLDRNSLIPFAPSIEGLEYDLCQRIRSLVFGSARSVCLVFGNGLPESRSDLVRPWLSLRGFSVSAPDGLSLARSLDGLTGRDAVVVLGSRALSREQCAAIERAVMRGVPAVVATSPYSVDVEGDWSVSKNAGDNLIPALTSWGFAFGSSLVNDISCVPLVLESADGAGLFQTVNYPLWISAAPQGRMGSGGSFFWASPLILYGGAAAAVRTSDRAWLQNESGSEEFPFAVSPFSAHQSARDAGKENGQFVLCATADSVEGFYQKGRAAANVTVISGELFVDSAMTGFVSSDGAGDFRNFDFIAAELLRLSGDEDSVSLMEKGGGARQLFKIADAREFRAARTAVLAVHFALLPALVAGCFVFVKVKRR